MDDLAGRVRTLEAAVDAGAEAALAAFREDVPVETKAGPLDRVTAADRESQSTILDHLAGRYPDDPVVGEEADAPEAVPRTGVAWVVDPIDGTNNFVAGNRTWCTSVALVEDAAGVAAANEFPALGDRYRATPDGTTRNGTPVAVTDRADPDTATVGAVYGTTAEERRELERVAGTVAREFGDLRYLGCGQATLSMVASGELDAAVTTVEQAPWDTVAGVTLVRQAGGLVTDLAGDRWRHDSGALVASNGRVHDRLLSALRPTGGSR